MSALMKIFAALFFLLVVAVGLIAFLVDPNAYKGEIQTRFAEATGHELIIAGQLRLSLLPTPSLEITQLSIPGGLGNQGPALAELDQVHLYPRLLPLLDGRLELKLARVQGLRLRLIRDELGRTSWSRSKARPDSTGAVRRVGPAFSTMPIERPGPFDVMAAESSSDVVGPVIDRIEISNARIIWDDSRSGQRLVLDGLEVQASPIAPGQPVALNVTGATLDGNGVASVALRADSNLRVDNDAQRLRLDPLNLELHGLSLGKGVDANLSVRTRLEADLDARQYRAEALTFDAQVTGTALSGGRIEATASARLDLDLMAERLEVSDVSIRSGALSASGSALGQTLLSAPVLTGSLVVDELDLRAWLLQQGLPLPRTADPETFRKFSFDAHWRAEVGQLVLHDLDMEVDETGISGNIQRVRTGHPRFGFELVADRLDLDRYLPAVGNAKEKPQKKPPQEPGQHASTAKSAVLQREAVDETPTASGANVPSSAMSATVVGPAMPELALGTLGNSDLAGRLRVGELHLAALRFGDADLRIRAKDGSLDIDNLVARFYEGMLKGKLALNLGGMEPKIALDQRAEGVQFGSLFADLNWSDRLSGRGEISANLTATGLSEDALRRSLDGNVAISIPQGAIMGVNLERLVREAEARLRGRSAPTNLPMQTDFRDLRASGEVKNGVLSNHDLIASADHLRITGAGILDLTKERIDYRFDPMFVKPPQGRGIKELEGIPIPVHLTGPFNQPLWEVDISDALRAAAKRRLDDQGGDLFKGLDERTGIKGLEKGLKNLFGR